MFSYKTVSNRRDRKLLLAILMVVLIVSLLLGACGEPAAPLKVKNDTDQTLSIYVVWDGKAYYVGDVAPGAEIKNKNLNILQFSSFPIEAKDTQGNVVYSDEYSDIQLIEAHWRIVITQADLKQ